MKLTREEIKSLAYKVGLPNLYLEWSDNFESFALAMYRRGADDMRERAALLCANGIDIQHPTIPEVTLHNFCRSYDLEDAIRALPIGDE